MSEKGWIKSHRKKLDWEWFTEPLTAHLFDYLLHKVNYEEKRWKGMVVSVGELVTSCRRLSEETGLSIQQVRTALKNLESTQDITITTTNKNTLIKVNNFIRYQRDDKQVTINQQTNNKQITNEQQTNNNQITTTKEIKKERRKEIKNVVREQPAENPEKSQKITLNGVDIDPTDIQIWEEAYPNIDVVLELKRINAWLKANPGRGLKKEETNRWINLWLSQEEKKASKAKADASFKEKDTDTGLPEWYSNKPNTPQSEETKKALEKRLERINDAKK